MKTLLFGKSNAVLTCEETKEGKVIAIISCGKKEDISKKVERAIKERYVAKSVSIVDSERETLTNGANLIFSAVIKEDGHHFGKTYEFCLEVTATY